MEGEILEAFPSGMFRVNLDNGHELLAYTAGRCAGSGSAWPRAIA